MDRLRALIYEYKCICRIAQVRFPIVSGYRSREYQVSRFNGLRHRHTHGYALDLAPVEGWTVRQMAVIAVQRWREPDSRLVGIGINPNWLHIDIKPRKCRRIWRTTTYQYRD